jgi:hypothetical protein
MAVVVALLALPVRMQHRATRPPASVTAHRNHARLMRRAGPPSPHQELFVPAVNVCLLQNSDSVNATKETSRNSLQVAAVTTMRVRKRRLRIPAIAAAFFGT